GVRVERRETRRPAVAERVHEQRERYHQNPPLEKSAPLMRLRARLPRRRRQPRRDQRHHDVQRRRFDAHRRPAEMKDPEADERRDGDRGDRRQAPVRDPFGAAPRRQHVREVGGRRGQEAGPEHAMDDHERQDDVIVRQHRVGQREARERDAGGEQDRPRSEPIRERASRGRRERGRVRQEPEKQPRRERAAPERQDPERRCREELERGQENGEGEAAHHEKARRQQSIGQWESAGDRISPPSRFTQEPRMVKSLRSVTTRAAVVLTALAISLASVRLLSAQAPAAGTDGGLPPIIDRDLFFGDPEIAGAQISPDGQFIAFLKPFKGTRNIWVKGAAEPFDKARPITADTKRPISAYFWSRDAKYILYSQDAAGDENFNVYAVLPSDTPAAGSDVPAARNITDLKG